MCLVGFPSAIRIPVLTPEACAQLVQQVAGKLNDKLSAEKEAKRAEEEAHNATRAELTRVQRELQATRREKAAIEEENARLEREVDTTKGASLTERGTREGLEEECNKLQRMNERLLQRLQDLGAEVALMKSDRDRGSEGGKEIAAIEERWQERCADLRARLEDETEARGELMTELERLRVKVGEKEREASEVKETLTSQTKEFAKEREALKSEAGEAEKQMSDAELRVEREVQRRVAEVTAELEKQRNTDSGGGGDGADVAKLVKQHSAKLAHIEQERQAERARHKAELDARVALMKRDMDALQSKLQKEFIEKETSKLAELRREFDAQADRIRAEGRKEVAAAKAEMAALERQFRQATKKREQQAMEREDELENQLELATAAKVVAEKQAQAAERALAEVTERLGAELESRETSLREKRREIKDMTAAMDALVKSNEALKARAGAAVAEAAAQSVAVAQEATQSSQKTESDLARYKQMIVDMQRENKRLGQEVRSERVARLEQADAVKALRRERNELKSSLAEAQEEIALIRRGADASRADVSAPRDNGARDAAASSSGGAAGRADDSKPSSARGDGGAAKRAPRHNKAGHTHVFEKPRVMRMAGPSLLAGGVVHEENVESRSYGPGKMPAFYKRKRPTVVRSSMGGAMLSQALADAVDDVDWEKGVQPPPPVEDPVKEAQKAKDLQRELEGSRALKRQQKAHDAKQAKAAAEAKSRADAQAAARAKPAPGMSMLSEADLAEMGLSIDDL